MAQYKKSKNSVVKTESNRTSSNTWTKLCTKIQILFEIILRFDQRMFAILLKNLGSTRHDLFLQKFIAIPIVKTQKNNCQKLACSLLVSFFIYSKNIFSLNTTTDGKQTLFE